MTAETVTDGGTDHREVARASSRVAAAMLDGLVAWSIFSVTVMLWGLTTTVGDGSDDVPWWVQAIAGVLVWLYLTVGWAGGATPGKRAAGIRVRRAADGAAPGLLRAGARATVLIGLLWLLPGWFLLPFAVVFLLLGRRSARWRLPHDLVAGTVGVPAGAPSPGPVTPPAVGSLPPDEARALLHDLGDVRRRAAGAQHRGAAPMTVLGTVLLGAAAVSAVSDFVWPQLYWVVAGPAGLLITAAWYRRQRRRDGAGPGGRDVAVIAAVTGCVAVGTLLLPVGPVVTALGFLAVARRRRAAALGVAAVVAGTVAELEVFRVLSSQLAPRVPALDTGTFTGGPASGVVLGALGAALLLVGAAALRRERHR